ncbi:HicB family protein [Lysinibacillus sp. KCTC 33748]|uniref:HicB family protein n=1 Tax=unclassified Lysinibacillus TaxID=2636778 RepID=UPI0009A79E1C|nr:MULTISPECIES: HicB family protein [unclassified Lysinibacillus]OXS76499.1 HicB family protein [Lysinibacillus sp. KCTC 33748]
MLYFGELVYPAFIQQDADETYGVYFPTLFPENGWDIPLCWGKTKLIAIKNAEKDLAYSLAGILYDNEELPKPIPIQSNNLSQGMDLIHVKTSFEPYAEEIQEHLKNAHWHIDYYAEEYEERIEAIGYKNDQGKWDIQFGDYSEEEEILFFDSSHRRNPEWPFNMILFSVHTRSEAQEKFNQFVEKVVIKHRTSIEWLEREKERLKFEKDNKKIMFKSINELVKKGQISAMQAAILKKEVTDPEYSIN